LPYLATHPNSGLPAAGLMRRGLPPSFLLGARLAWFIAPQRRGMVRAE
jgi:hypothetical protein